MTIHSWGNYPKTINNTLSFEQGLREEKSLKGITDIGLRVEKATN